MQRKKSNNNINKRLGGIAALFLAVSLGIYIILSNLEENIIFFHTPSEVMQANFSDNNKPIRLGGLVKEGSITNTKQTQYRFVLTDNKHDVLVIYKGILPALFRANQGIVAEGSMIGNTFIANRLLTKHDENYKPPILSKITADGE